MTRHFVKLDHRRDPTLEQCIDQMHHVLSGHSPDNIQVALTVAVVSAIIAMAPVDKEEQRGLAKSMYEKVLEVLSTAEIQAIDVHASSKVH